MSYVNKMTLEQLAVHYKKYSDEQAMEEFRRRDRISKMTYDERMGLQFKETDNQMPLEFSSSEGDNSSVWSEAYEAGYQAGVNKARVRRPSLPPSSHGGDLDVSFGGVKG